MAKTFDLNLPAPQGLRRVAAKSADKRMPVQAWAWVSLLLICVWLCLNSAAARPTVPSIAPQALPVVAPAPEPTVAGAGSSLAAATGPSIRWDGQDLVIEVQAARLAELARALAAQTGTELLGELALLNEARPLSLRWRGRDPQQAWALLLQGQASYATHCFNQYCRVWILGHLLGHPLGRLAPEPAGAAPPVASPPHRTAEPDPPGLFPAE
ncbi:hypothetical protein LNV08_15480 [Paucibacter sp. TC2R-5]|uniref:hypothetical protein n=1 Tax=Paucibacter sp. TC2R-5 TaxID=2893555 RepID=UPI0021E43F99|nr:hypothetical protein [Paucibacter sp. TC2R-5]MCV2360377.1 hypothetical protein [Paucibacter sp. TC2R-5]